MSECPECGRHTVTAGACLPDCGWVAHEAVAILTDLITELRAGHPKHGDRAPLWVRQAVAGAEQRLRELDAPPKPVNDQLNSGGAR